VTLSEPPRQADAVVVGAGIIGACCADALTAAGMSVAVVERGSLAGGTTAAGEGNILVSDKEPGPELSLAQLSNQLWRRLGEELDENIELEAKGGLVVALTPRGHDGLTALADRQRRAGVEARPVTPVDALTLEPHLTPEVLGGVHYPEDLQVQPVRASSAILRRARRAGAVLVTGAAVNGITADCRGRVSSVETDDGSIATPTVINAAGAWSGEVAALAGSDLPVIPRRGQILVTEPLPTLIRHKVYDADYVGTVAGDPGRASVSSVIEGTTSGPVLIGSSRELVGFDRMLNTALLARMAQRAIRLFPVLAGVNIIRTYLGFRPYPPDGLPIIGTDPRVPGLVHAAGHEGAGIGLAPGTGALVAALVTGSSPPVAVLPFAPNRPGLQRTSDAL
jgi:D-hydroxyproline dehydrogenase subunit beta